MARAAAGWSLYLVRTKDGALYTGITVDVERRLSQHAAGRGAKALRGRGPLQLAFVRRIGTHGAALRLERRVKRLDKAAKERLVARGLPRGWLTAARGTAGTARGAATAGSASGSRPLARAASGS